MPVGPIILTARMGKADFAWADAQRRRHFPPDRNIVPAHITLFHHLPPSIQGELRVLMAHYRADTPPVARLSAVLNLGKGVGYRVESDELLMYRAEIADHFSGMLTPQDQAAPRLHITVQNKVTAEAARALYAELVSSFRPRPLTIAGLEAWEYQGGPWRPLFFVPFEGR